MSEPDEDRCGFCGAPLPANGPSLYFCPSTDEIHGFIPSACQLAWYTARTSNPYEVLARPDLCAGTCCTSAFVGADAHV